MIKIVVPISGGKDSQACLKIALQEYDNSEILGLFCDTKFEHPLTYLHIEQMRDIYNVNIKTICAGNIPDKVLKHNMFPMGGARFCTDQLKIQPSIKFYKNLFEQQGNGFEIWLGMRAQESIQRKKKYNSFENNEIYLPNDIMTSFPKYLGDMGIRIKLPVVDYSLFEIFNLLDGFYNPLYKKGFSRVGCFPCLAAGDADKFKSFTFDETGRKHHRIVIDLEKQIGKSVYKKNIDTKSDDMFEGCALCSI